MASIRSRKDKNGDVTHAVLFRETDPVTQKTKQRSETFEEIELATTFKKLVETIGPEEARKVLHANEGTVSEHTVDSWCRHYIDHLTGIEAGTRERYRRMLANDFWTLGKLPLIAVDSDHIKAWVNEQVEAGFQAKTIANKHGFISGAFKEAQYKKLITSNPCERTRLPDSEAQEMVFLTETEFERLLPFVRDHERPLVITLVGTGLRFGEATALQPRDIDLTHSTITVRRAWKYTHSSKQKLGPPKTRKSKRTISIPKVVAEAIRPLLVGLGPEDLIFLRPSGLPWTGPSFHSTVWQPAVRRANGLQPKSHKSRAKPGNGPRIRKDGQPWGDRKSLMPVQQDPELYLGKFPRVHDLRHTCASWMIKANVPLPAIQAHFGHESITTTIDRYGHLDPVLKISAAQAIQQAFTQPKALLNA